MVVHFAMRTDYPYPFRPRSLAIDGRSLSYIDAGQGPVIVMLHGNPTWSFYYRNLASSLAKEYRVIVPDHLGCGLSDKPQDYPYRLENHINNLEQLIAHLGVDKVSLVMHDWGGAIGMGFAGRHPERIASLTVMNTAAFHSAMIPWRIRLCRTPLLGPLLVRGLNAFSQAALLMAVSKPLPREVARGYVAPYDSWRNRVAVLRFVQDIPLSEKDPSWKTLTAIEAGLDQFKDTPMLILWGGKDFCFTRHFYEQWRKRFPAAESHYFADAGHYVLEDAFDRIVPLVNRFYAGLSVAGWNDKNA